MYWKTVLRNVSLAKQVPQPRPYLTWRGAPMDTNGHQWTPVCTNVWICGCVGVCLWRSCTLRLCRGRASTTQVCVGPLLSRSMATCITPAINEGRTRSLRISHTSRRAPLQPVPKTQVTCTPYHPPNITGVTHTPPVHVRHTQYTGTDMLYPTVSRASAGAARICPNLS
jgi:hypothetical protein